MAITFIAASSANADRVTEVVVPKPTGTQEGDIIVFLAACSRSTFTYPAGFIERESIKLADQTDSLGYKIATASEPASYTFSAAPQDIRSIVLLATYRGQDASTPIDSSNIVKGGADLTAIMNDTTPNQADSLVFVGVGTERGNNGDPIIGSTTTGLNEVLDNVNGPSGNSNNVSSGAILDQIQVGAPTTVSGNFSLTMNSGATAWSTSALVVKPGAAVGDFEATAQGTSDAQATIGLIGSTEGTSDALGIMGVEGTAQGTSEALGEMEAVTFFEGTAEGNSQALGEIGIAGNAVGTSEALGVMLAIGFFQGTAAGTSEALAISGLIGIAQGTSEASGDMLVIDVSARNKSKRGVFASAKISKVSASG